MAATHPIGAEATARAPLSARALEDALGARLAEMDGSAQRREFLDQGSFLKVDEFLPHALTERLIEAVAAAEPAVHRNYLPRHKQGGSVGRHDIDRLAPVISELYRSGALIEWLGRIAGEPLQPSPPEDPHAYALYFYTRAGDHIGWHYDTSYYAGRRYTLLVGLIDESSCRLEYELHTREPGKKVAAGAVKIPPGGLVFFDGDKLRHRITPSAPGERRVSLTLEYLTDPKMHFGWRLISNMKDAIAYFGFRQVFRGGLRTGRRP
jgi:hypothetical protein